MGHVVENVLHGAAVRERTGPHLPVGLLPSLALVCVEQQDQLLLDQLALLRVSCGDGRRHGHTAGTPSQGQHGCLLLGLLLELLLKEVGGRDRRYIISQNQETSLVSLYQIKKLLGSLKDVQF